MKFVTFARNRETHAGLLNTEETEALDISSVLGYRASDMKELIEKITESELRILHDVHRGICGAGVRYQLSDVEAKAPILRPPHDIICVGVNYSAHAEEVKENIGNTSKDERAETVYFGKRTSGITGPGEQIIGNFDLDRQLDYEAELAVIIGKAGRNISPEEAEEYIFGYSVFNDVSSRAVQSAHFQWYRGKSFDTYAAMGPCILHKSAMPFPIEAKISCTVNGELRQSSNTRYLIKNIPELISELSRGMTLEPGDIIATGTPSGTGMGFAPPRFLRPGDVVCCRIPEIGDLVNTVAPVHF